MFLQTGKCWCSGSKAGVRISWMESLKSPVYWSRREGLLEQSPEFWQKQMWRHVSLLIFASALCMPLGSRERLLIHQKDWELQRGGGRAGALLSKYFKEPQGLREVPGVRLFTKQSLYHHISYFAQLRLCELHKNSFNCGIPLLHWL